MMIPGLSRAGADRARRRAAALQHPGLWYVKHPSGGGSSYTMEQIGAVFGITAGAAEKRIKRLLKADQPITWDNIKAMGRNRWATFTYPSVTPE